jgi:hypothetical protein
MKTPTKCIKCGSDRMWIEESLGFRCTVDEEGNVDCSNKYNEIESIHCFDCNEPWHVEDYNKINF